MSEPALNQQPSGPEGWNTRRPVYELRARALTHGQSAISVWQMPCEATPYLRKPERVAALKGRVLAQVEPLVRRALKERGVVLTGLRQDEDRAWTLDEDTALVLGLLFRVLAPMRNPERIHQVAQGVVEMSREEAGYWLGMAIYRKNPRRVLAALRMLLTTP